MPNIEHPAITRCNRTGYPNADKQHEHFGVDVYGTEILTSDDYVEDVIANELIHKDNLEKYIKEYYGFEFKTAE